MFKYLVVLASTLLLLSSFALADSHGIQYGEYSYKLNLASYLKRPEVLNRPDLHLNLGRVPKAFWSRQYINCNEFTRDVCTFSHNFWHNLKKDPSRCKGITKNVCLKNIETSQAAYKRVMESGELTEEERQLVVEHLRKISQE